jgi:hypothetical protein
MTHQQRPQPYHGEEYVGGEPVGKPLSQFMVLVLPAAYDVPLQPNTLYRRLKATSREQQKVGDHPGLFETTIFSTKK